MYQLSLPFDTSVDNQSSYKSSEGLATVDDICSLAHCFILTVFVTTLGSITYIAVKHLVNVISKRSCTYTRPVNRVERSLKTRPFAREEEGTGYMPIFKLSPQNSIVCRYNYQNSRDTYVCMIITNLLVAPLNFYQTPGSNMT